MTTVARRAATVRSLTARNLVAGKPDTDSEEAIMRLMIAVVHRAELDAKSSNRKLRRAARRWLTLVRKGAAHGRT